MCKCCRSVTPPLDCHNLIRTIWRYGEASAKQTPGVQYFLTLLLVEGLLIDLALSSYKKILSPKPHIYRTRVRSLGMLVTNSLTHSLTDSCFVNLIDVTLACKDAYSKLVEVVTVADVSDENRVGNSLMKI